MGKGHCPKWNDCAVAKFEMEMEPLRLPVITLGALLPEEKEEEEEDEEGEEKEKESGRTAIAQILSS